MVTHQSPDLEQFLLIQGKILQILYPYLCIPLATLHGNISVNNNTVPEKYSFCQFQMKYEM